MLDDAARYAVYANAVYSGPAGICSTGLGCLNRGPNAYRADEASRLGITTKSEWQNYCAIKAAADLVEDDLVGFWRVGFRPHS